MSLITCILFNFLEYWNMRNLENVCFITYEEMKNDLASVIRKVSTFLTRPVAEEKIPSLVDHLSFDKMKQNKSVNKQEFVEVSNFLKASLKTKFQISMFVHEPAGN